MRKFSTKISWSNLESASYKNILKITVIILKIISDLIENILWQWIKRSLWVLKRRGGFSLPQSGEPENYFWLKSFSTYVAAPALRGPVTLFCRSFSSGSVTTFFYDIGLSRLGFEHPTFHLRGQRSNPMSHRRGSFYSANSYFLFLCSCNGP